MGYTLEVPDSEDFLPCTDGMEVEDRGAVSKAESLGVVSQNDYLNASEYLKRLKGIRAEVILLFEKPKASAFKAHREVCAAERKLLDPLEQASKILDKKISLYLLEARRREEEAAAKIRKEAENQARQEAEAQRKKIEEAQLIAARELEAKGNIKAAMELIATPIETPIVAPIFKKQETMKMADGQHLKITYKAEVFDLLALIKGVASGLLPATYILPNQKALNDMASTLKHELRIDGVRVVEGANTIQRRAGQ